MSRREINEIKIGKAKLQKVRKYRQMVITKNRKIKEKIVNKGL